MRQLAVGALFLACVVVGGLAVAAMLGGCVRGRINDDTGAAEVSVSLPASTERVRALEQEVVKAYDATAALVAESQTDLAGALARFEEEKKGLEATIAEQDLLDLLPESVVDWGALLLGVGVTGGAGATVASRKRRGVGLLSGKPKRAKGAAAAPSAFTVFSTGSGTYALTGTDSGPTPPATEPAKT